MFVLNKLFGQSLFKALAGSGSHDIGQLFLMFVPTFHMHHLTCWSRIEKSDKVLACYWMQWDMGGGMSGRSSIEGFLALISLSFDIISLFASLLSPSCPPSPKIQFKMPVCTTIPDIPTWSSKLPEISGSLYKIDAYCQQTPLYHTTFGRLKKSKILGQKWPGAKPYMIYRYGVF